MRAVLGPFLICSVAVLAGCESGENSPLGVESPAEWVAIDPIQCHGNPWEADWIAQHPGEPYPDDPGKEPFNDKVRDIVEAYYAQKGIEILDAQGVIWPPGGLCDACSCPAGWTLYLLVSVDDVPAMLALGFRSEAPAR